MNGIEYSAMDRLEHIENLNRVIGFREELHARVVIPDDRGSLHHDTFRQPRLKRFEQGLEVVTMATTVREELSHYNTVADAGVDGRLNEVVMNAFLILLLRSRTCRKCNHHCERCYAKPTQHDDSPGLLLVY